MPILHLNTSHIKIIPHQNSELPSMRMQFFHFYRQVCLNQQNIKNSLATCFLCIKTSKTILLHVLTGQVHETNITYYIYIHLQKQHFQECKFPHNDNKSYINCTDITICHIRKLIDINSLFFQ